MLRLRVHLGLQLLRHLLQGAAERLLAKEEEGISTTGIQYAVDIGKAVELPQKRLDAARGRWEEAQAPPELVPAQGPAGVQERSKRSAAGRLSSGAGSAKGPARASQAPARAHSKWCC